MTRRKKQTLWRSILALLGFERRSGTDRRKTPICVGYCQQGRKPCPHRTECEITERKS